MQVLEKCTICGSKRIHIQYRNVEDYHTNIEGKYNVWKCDNCGLFFINPMLNNEELGKCYESNYYSYQAFELGDEKVSFVRTIARKILMVKMTTRPKLPLYTRILDVGCGAGEWLWEMKKKGYYVKGCEISDKAANLGKELTGIDIYGGALTDRFFHDKEFDFIRSNHSFEHINNPNETIKEMNRVLSVGGYLLINVPNTDSLWCRLYRKYWYYLGVPIHVYNYNRRNLSLLLTRNGFRIEKVCICGYNDGFLGSAQIKHNQTVDKNLRSNEGNIFNNQFFRIIGQCVAKIINSLGMGDCIEILAVKEND